MTKKITLMLLAFCLAFALSGCNSSFATTLSDNEIDTLFAQRLHSPELPPDETPAETICTDYTDRGLLRICYVKQADVKHKLQVLKGDQHVDYNLKADGSVEDFSLQFGSGDYTARILQNESGSNYFEVDTKSFSVSLSSDTIPFLNAVQNVRWNAAMTPIKEVRRIIAPALARASDDDLPRECTRDLYDYICMHIKYDNDKTQNVDYDYVPDIEETYATEKGICYDYASLFASMLRSIGIPAKLVKGYANANPTVYHAWNEVYLDGSWHVIDTTLDASAGMTDMMFKNASDYTKVSEY